MLGGTDPTRIQEDTITNNPVLREKSVTVYSRGVRAIKAEGEGHMMIDWSEYHKEIGSRLGELMKLSPDTVDLAGLRGDHPLRRMYCGAQRGGVESRSHKR